MIASSTKGLLMFSAITFRIIRCTGLIHVGYLLLVLVSVRFVGESYSVEFTSTAPVIFVLNIRGSTAVVNVFLTEDFYCLMTFTHKTV